MSEPDGPIIMRQWAEVVGVDLDKPDHQTWASFNVYVEGARRRARMHGMLIHTKRTKKGAHIKIKLPEAKEFWDCINIRYHVGDDPRRMFYDIMRYRGGGKMLDTLFDKKRVYNAD